MCALKKSFSQLLLYFLPLYAVDNERNLFLSQNEQL